MSIRKAAWGLGTCVGITLSANVHAIALFHFESVESAVPEFKYHIPRVRMEAGGTGGTGENSNYLSWNRSLDGILPLTPGYLDTLPLLGSFASPSIGSDLPALGGNEAFTVNIAGFTNDEAGVADLLVIPDLFMQTQWQPTESTLPTTPFTLHSYSGNAARARSACMQARNVSGSKSGLRDSDCIKAGSGESGGGANKSGNRVGSGPRSIPGRGAGGGGTVLDGAPSGGGGSGASGGGAGGGRDTAAPGTGERGNGVGVPASGSNNSDSDNSSPGSPPGFADTGRTQDNDNNGAGEGSGGGGGGTGGNEDWGSGNGDTGNWNNPGEWEGTPPSEVLAIPEPDTLALLALGAAAMRIVRRNRSKPVGPID